MAYLKRKSMNSTLRDARIFDDDSWDESMLRDDSNEDKIKNQQETSPCVDDSVSIKIKQEPISDSNEFKANTSITIKKESEIKKEILIEDASSSPFYKDLFSKCSIRQDVLEQFTPVKGEYENSNSNESSGRRSVKRTVFKRDSPYKVPNEANTSETADKTNGTKRPSVMSRLGPKVDNGDKSEPKKKKRRTTEVETDPETLKRRQKQIDFGKNTVGYDNYITAVLKSERKPDDPQTPNKFGKYSRRGWDGLIKQWRLRLHKYD